MSYVETVVGKYKMKLNTSFGGIHKDLLKISNKGGEREPELLYLLRQEVSPGMYVMDLGANIGYVSLLLCDLVGETGKLISVEPDPENFNTLNYNIKLNNFQSRVRSLNIGISNKSSKMNFYVGKNASNLGSMILSKNTQQTPIQVDVLNLSDFFIQYGYPQLIKMDIEGHEVEVLEGMYESIQKNNFPCKIIMELHPVCYSEVHSLEKWVKKFFQFGFITKYIISAAVPKPDLFKEWGYDYTKVFGSRALYDGTIFSVDHVLKSCCHVNKQWMPGKKKYSPKIVRFLMIERGT